MQDGRLAASARGAPRHPRPRLRLRPRPADLLSSRRGAQRSSATTLRWEKSGQPAVFWDHQEMDDASSGRGRRTNKEHVADTFPLVGQRIIIGRGVDGGATGVILAYLTEKIVQLKRDDSGEKETLSLEARPFSLVRGGPDLIALIADAPAEQHDRLARRWFKTAPRADIDVRDLCFAERLDRLLREGYAPRAINLAGVKLLHAEPPELASELLDLRIISKKKGRGYAAAAPIAPGTILLREIGLRVPLNNPEALSAAILLACATEPDCVWDKPGLCGACEDMPSVRDSFVPCLIGPGAREPPTLSEWNTAREQVASNFFTSDQPPSNVLQGYGSFFNHSCDPNAAWNHTSMGQFVVRAIKPIKEGEEVVFTYSDEIGNDDSVFKCACDACARRRKRQTTNARKGVEQWVQCDSCGKWRQTPYTIEQLKSVPSNWRCIDLQASVAAGGDEVVLAGEKPEAEVAAACAVPEELHSDDDTYILDEEDQAELVYSDEEETEDGGRRKRRRKGSADGASIAGGVPRKRAASPIVAATAAEWEFPRPPPVLTPAGMQERELSDAAMQSELLAMVCGAQDEEVSKPLVLS